MLAVNETEKLHGEQLLQLNISLLTQPANEGNKHLWGGMSTLNSKNFMHHPAGALGKLLWKLEGLGYPLGGTFPADANTEGVRGERKLLDGLITTLIIRSNCADYSSSSICLSLCMHDMQRMQH